MSYDPFEAGSHRVSVRPIRAADASRDRVFDCEIWSPIAEASRGSVPFPVIVFSHSSGGSRTSAGYLCEHLASHGYVVAAMDHSETVAPELAPAPGESAEQCRARVGAIIAGRVPDVRYLLDFLLDANGTVAAGARSDARAFRRVAAAGRGRRAIPGDRGRARRSPRTVLTPPRMPGVD